MKIKNIKEIALTFVCLILVTGNFFGQSKVIELWKGKNKLMYDYDTKLETLRPFFCNSNNLLFGKKREKFVKK